jgi:DNA-binding NarL/FixJ family response regulator
VGHVALSVLHSVDRADFAEDAIANLEALASPLLSILGKHASALWQRRQLLESLSSLEAIERCVATAPSALPRREAQVCSLILYGRSSLGIALELGVSEETVMTYRKRVYHRLNIGTQRELLMWYVSLWSVGTTMPRRIPVSLGG